MLNKHNFIIIIERMGNKSVQSTCQLVLQDDQKDSSCWVLRRYFCT